MRSVVENLLSALSDRGAKRIRDVRMGLGYTAVQLESGATGLAYTLRDDLKGGCTVFRGPRPLVGRPVSEVLPYLTSQDVLEAALGLATANALVSERPTGTTEGDVLDALELRETDEVAMIGHFEPLVDVLRQRVGTVRIFERGREAAGFFPSEAAPEWLSRSDVALVTATSLLNGTLDGLLRAAGACRQVALIGPSTPLLPEIFEDTPVTCLSGVEVTSPEGLLRVVSEGGGMGAFRRLVRKVILAMPSSTGG